MKKVLFLGIAMLMFVFTACNKESERNIIGSWKLVLLQESYESDSGDYGTDSEAVEANLYYDFQKDGVLVCYDEDGRYENKWAYVDGKIVINDETFNIENFSHKEMDLVLTDYYEEYDEEDDHVYWSRYTYRMHFKREKTPKEYRNQQ